jgi:hypothetical protein
MSGYRLEGIPRLDSRSYQLCVKLHRYS